MNARKKLFGWVSVGLAGAVVLSLAIAGLSLRDRIGVVDVHLYLVVVKLGVVLGLTSVLGLVAGILAVERLRLPLLPYYALWVHGLGSVLFVGYLFFSLSPAAQRFMMVCVKTLSP